MGVRITEIKVQSLGPLREFDMAMGSLNVIYGRNECGKTYLVEFILRSLFKNTNAWDPRDVSGANGHVAVSGLGEKPIKFSPKGKPRKLEEQLSQCYAGLPITLPRLLVVKGADLKIVRDSRAGLDRTILRDCGWRRRTTRGTRARRRTR